MYKTNSIDIDKRITIGINELQEMLSVGRNTALKIGEESKAVVRVGRRKLYNVEKIKSYMEGLNDE